MSWEKKERKRFFGLPVSRPGALTLLTGTQHVEFHVEAGALKLEDIENAAASIMDAPNYGQPTQLFVNKKVLADLKKTFIEK